MKMDGYVTSEGMCSYSVTKPLDAKPMGWLEYNAFRGWDLPDDEDGSEDGYLVIHSNSGFTAWMPKDVFEAMCTRLDG